MNVQFNRPSTNSDGRAQTLGRVTLASHLGISAPQIDIKDEPLGPRLGAKRPTRITCRLGGCASHGGCVAVANGIDCGVLGPQAAGHWADVCRDLARRDGLQPLIVEREGVPCGMTIAHPNGDGTLDLDVQRMAPLTGAELAEFTEDAATRPRSVFVGPALVDEDSRNLHAAITRLASSRALMAHPSLLRHNQQFSEIGKLYAYVQMNYAEACILDESTCDIAKLGCRARFLLGDQVDFAITNGPKRGLLWAEGRWYIIEPCVVRTVVSDIGAGDVWGAAFMIARWYFDATPNLTVSGLRIDSTGYPATSWRC